MRAERKRILYVHPNNEVGGSDIALLRLLQGIDRTRIDPIVVVPGDGPITPLLLAERIEMHVVPMMQLRTLPSLSYQARYLARMWPTVRRLAGLMRAARADLVHTNSLYCLYGGFAARLAGVPHLWHVREIPPAIPIARPALGRLVLSLSQLVICMTNACSRSLFGPRADDPRIRHLGEGVDLAFWSPEAVTRSIRNELGILPGTPIVGFVARLDPWKGLDVFIDAAAQVATLFPDAVFVVSGDAPSGMEAYRDRMVARAAALNIGDRVRFLGWRYRLSDMPAVMGALDVFCHTSVAPEPFGMVIIEAMAMRCPVIASNAGGPMEIVEDGVSGLLVEPRNPNALAAAIVAILGDPALQRRLSDGGQARVAARYSRDVHSAELRAICEEALAGPSA